MAKKESLRNADSGVWMGSDDSIDSIVSSQQRLQGLAMEDETDDDFALVETVPDGEALASKFIQHCLDNGKETVDLSDLGLHALSDATIRPLHQLVRQAFADFTHPPSEEEFGPLTPSIQLFLSRNQLSSLPAELFNLTNISVLSLRNNQLKHLPPAIARLQNLTELNIAGNGMRHLPWELLDIIHCQGKHRQITVRPNPLVEPVDLSGPSPLPKAHFTQAVKSEDLNRFGETRLVYENLRRKYQEDGCLNMRGELELRRKLGRMMRMQYLQEASRAGRELKLCREELIYLASSAVYYFGVDGTPMRRGTGMLPPEADYGAVLEPTANKPASAGSAAVPSLFELALRGMQASYNLQDLLPHLPNSDLSLRLTSALRAAARNAAGNGNETCSTCGQGFVIARAEWMEYWFNGFPSQTELTSETVLPFLRRSCSWACAQPSEMGEFRC